MRISLIVSLVLTIFGNSFAKDILTNNNLVADNGIGKVAFHVYEHCESSDDIIKCFKAQLSKLLGRALKVQQIKLLDGILLTKKSNYPINDSKSNNYSKINNNDVDNLSSKSLDQIFYSRLMKFLESHQVQVNVPKLLSYGQKNANEFIESRKKKDKKFLGPFIAAVLLKTGMLKIAYHSIAIVAGKALIVGKIALIISAIIGLKKLVSNDGHEKTTYEIVKHPHVQQSHTYSSSHSGDYEGESGGSYHRSLVGNDEEMMMQDKAYRAHYQKV